MDEQNFGPWPGWTPPNPQRRNNPVTLNRVASYEEVKKDKIPPNSMKAYFREDEDIVYVKTTDSNGNALDRGFNMSEFSIEEEEALNGAVTEARLREAMGDVRADIRSMFNELKEELVNGKQSVQSEKSNAVQNSGNKQSKDRREHSQSGDGNCS